MNLTIDALGRCTQDLRNLEIKLFTILLDVSEVEVHAMLELIGKALNGRVSGAFY